MGIGRFFKKIGQGTKDFFKKGGIAEKGITTGLRKVGNTLAEASPIINKIGEIAGMASPALAGVPLVGGLLSKGAEQLSKHAPAISKAVKSIGNTSKGISQASKQNMGNIGDMVSNSLDVVKSNIQAPKPKPEKQTAVNLFDELPFA